jgi:hypothetical protein
MFMILLQEIPWLFQDEILPFARPQYYKPIFREKKFVCDTLKVRGYVR